MGDGTLGAYVISWAQTAVDDVAGAPPGDLRAGASWRWVGQALRIDRPSGPAALGQAIGMAELHARAARSARRLCAPVVPLAAPAQTADLGDEQLLDRGFVVTDGRRAFSASRIEPGPGQPALVLFYGMLPPQDAELWVVRVFSNRRAEARLGRRAEAPVTGIARGSWLATPQGPRPVETLRPGDAVLTRDAGPCTIRWRGIRRFSTTDLTREPRDRPLRIAAGAMGGRWRGPDLCVGPDQHLLIGGPAVRALFGGPEVLARAGDLRDHTGVTPAPEAAEVIYVQLLLDSHQILQGHGMGCDSFHPDMAAPPGEAFLEPGLLRELGPEILRAPGDYGPPVRRRLSRAEAALLSAGGDLRAVA